MSRRRRAALSLTGAILGLAVAIAVPGHGRVLALFAYLLLLGGAGSAALVWLMARANPVAEEAFWQPPPAQPQRVRQLDEITRELETVLKLASDAGGELGARLRIVATARLADRRGIELDLEPERARAAIDDELTWRLIEEREPFERVELPALGPAELSSIVASLEQL